MFFGFFRVCLACLGFLVFFRILGFFRVFRGLRVLGF